MSSGRQQREKKESVSTLVSAWGMLATVLAVALLTTPVLLYVGAHAELTEWEYELTRLQRLESQEKERESRLSVALAEATAPDRIRREALAMGLRQYQATDIIRVTGRVRPQEPPPTPEESEGLLETMERHVAAVFQWAGLTQGGDPRGL